MKASSIKSWFNVHKWTSLVCTIFLLMLCITGLPLIFYEEIDHLLGNDIELPAIPENSPVYSTDKVLQVAMDQYPGKEAKYIFWDKKDHPGQMFVTLADSSEAPIEADHYITMDERTAKVLDTPPNEMTF